MGRKLIYKTKEEKRKALNLNRMRYYISHKEIEKQKALNRYYDKKQKNDL
jgi:hypothetical protein